VYVLARTITGEARLPAVVTFLMFIPPLITGGCALTSPYHEWLLRSPHVERTSGMLLTTFGPWFAVHVVYSYSLLVASFIHLAVTASRASPGHRERLWLTLATPIPSAIGDIAYLVGLTPLPGYSLSPAFAAFSGVLFFMILRRYHFFELAPIARHEVVDMIGEIVFVVDRQGKLADINLAGMREFHVRRPDRLGLSASGLFPGIDALLEKDAEAGAALPDVTLTADGQTSIYQVHASPLLSDGERRGRVFVLHDVTVSRQEEQKAREHAARLEELDRLKDGFVATISHELRTPLGSILGLTDVLLDSDLKEEDARHVRTIQQSGNLLHTLVNDILDLSKVKSGKLDLNAVPTVPGAVLEEVLESLQPVAARKGLRLDWYCPTPASPLLLDPVRLRQILLNLVGNALKFTAHGGVEIIGSLDGPTLTFRVTDTGPGIPADKRAMVFEEFTQVDSSTTRRAGGTGLGLPISRRLARFMGGDVTVDENPGGGSVFTATVRAELPPPSPHPVLPDAGVALVFAFRPLRARTLRDALQAQGYRVETFDVWDAFIARREEAPPVALKWIASASLTPEMLARVGQRPTVVEIEGSARAWQDRASARLQIVSGPVWTRDVPNLIRAFQQAPRPALKPVAEAPAPPVGPRVLIADDSPENRGLLAAYAAGQPIHIDFAADGREGVDLFQHEHYDVVFLDIEMPRMDGYGAVREMRRLERTEGRVTTPIVAITAHGLPEHIAATAAAGFSQHLTRPLGKKAFLEAVEDFGGEALRRGLSEEDPAVTRLRDGYLAKLRGQRDWLLERIEAADVPALVQFGHALFGTATSFGLMELGAIGRGIEVAAEGAPRMLPSLAVAFGESVETAIAEAARRLPASVA
jgi:signal transduction histidine kinase/CheY-like chemotaxis protein